VGSRKNERVSKELFRDKELLVEAAGGEPASGAATPGHCSRARTPISSRVSRAP
jgi:hypothetical protein